MLTPNPKTEAALRAGKKVIPGPIFRLFQPLYHWLLSVLAAVRYGFPSDSMKVIGVTGTKGKSTTAYMIAKIFEEQGVGIAMISSLGYKINAQEWPNTLKMTMPGRFQLQKFLAAARRAGVKYFVLEVTSEGIVQRRLNGVTVDCAVFTNLHKEHVEAHGSFENYMEAKKKLFQQTKNLHIINVDNKYAGEFLKIPARQKMTFGLAQGDVTQANLGIQLKLAAEFNIYNALAALTVSQFYGLDLSKAKATVEAIQRVPGRMEYLEEGQPFEMVIDYAHTPESLEGVYQTLKNPRPNVQDPAGRLICVLGAAGGGRDKWKRPVFGEIAANYCDEIILTNEDPYDEDPAEIIAEIEAGIVNDEVRRNVKKIIDRKEAITTAIGDARPGDTIVVTGKGSETSMALAGGEKIPWSDRDVVIKVLTANKEHAN